MSARRGTDSIRQFEAQEYYWRPRFERAIEQLRGRDGDQAARALVEKVAPDFYDFPALMFDYKRLFHVTTLALGKGV